MIEDVAEDVYTIISKLTKKSLIIDLRTPFVLNSEATIINVPYEDILIKNSIGELIYEVKKEDLLTITEKNQVNEDVTYYFLSLVDILFDPIDVVGYSYNKLYPLVDLEENEYGLVRGKIITGKDVIVNIRGYEILKNEVDVVKIVNYTNGNYIKRIEDNFTYHGEQTIGNKTGLKNIVKLNNAAIERGSVVISEYYENKGEFRNTVTSNVRFLNINTKQDPAFLAADPYHEYFIQE